MLNPNFAHYLSNKPKFSGKMFEFMLQDNKV